MRWVVDAGERRPQARDFAPGTGSPARAPAGGPSTHPRVRCQQLESLPVGFRRTGAPVGKKVIADIEHALDCDLQMPLGVAVDSVAGDKRLPGFGSQLCENVQTLLQLRESRQHAITGDHSGLLPTAVP